MAHTPSSAYSPAVLERPLVSILDDKLLSVRLSSRPEFLLRLAEFVHSYAVADRPSLVIQARPVPGSEASELGVGNLEAQKRLLAGVPSDDGFWQGFRSMTAVIPTFHGVAGLPSREQPAWAAEMHRDGHFIAGIWKFPQFPHRGSSMPALADFFVGMFRDFFQLVAAVLQAGSDGPVYEATATLVRAADIGYARRSFFGRHDAASEPLKIDNLQWPVAVARVGTPEWTSLASRMGAALTGAYGETPPPVQ